MFRKSGSYYYTSDATVLLYLDSVALKCTYKMGRRSNCPKKFMDTSCAYVTLLTKSSYLAGVLVLNHSLRQVDARYPLVVMITSSLPEEARALLRNCAIRTTEVTSLCPPVYHTLARHDSRFADTWTKLRVFGLKQFRRVVLLDCDMVMLRNMDELMTLDLPNDHIAAVHVCACNPRGIEHYPNDWRPDNCAHTAVGHPTFLPPPVTEGSPRPYGQLNSGTVVLSPSESLAEGLVKHLESSPQVAEWKFPDQDLLSEYFKGKWKPISWYYNALRSLRNSHPAMWCDSEVRCLHYIFADKPWQSRITAQGTENGFDLMDKWWWDRFDELGKTLAVADPKGWGYVLSTVDKRR